MSGGLKKKSENVVVFAPFMKKTYRLLNCLYATMILTKGQRSAMWWLGAAMYQYTLFLLGLLAMTSFIAYSTFATAQLLRRWRPLHNPLLDRADMLLRLALIAMCIGLGLLSGLDRTVLGWVAPTPLRQMLIGLLVGGVLAAGLFGFSQLVMHKTGERFVASQFVEMVAPRSTGELFRIGLALIPVVVLEELLFRSLLIGGLSPLAPVEALVFGVSVLFGAMHLPQGAAGIIGAGLASVVLGAIFLTEQSLLTPIVAHYVANFIQLGLAMRLLKTRENNKGE